MIAYSQRGAEEYRALGFSPQRVFVAPNAIVPRPGENPPLRPPAQAGRQKVLFVGRLQGRKRVDNLLRACAGLESDVHPQLTIVGDGPVRAELQQLAENIYPQAEFVGAVHGLALERYFSEADLFVLPGTGGLAVQQAMGYGLPVIAAEGDGTQDDLVHRENGWRVPPNDLPALQDALREALSDVERLHKMGIQSWRIVREEYNLESMVAGFLTAVTSVSALD
jgi:glycosyltransferase involved in cell wall biosynthesis